MHNWKKRGLHGQFLNKGDKDASEEKRLRLKDGSIKRDSGSIIFAAQEQAVGNSKNRVQEG